MKALIFSLLFISLSFSVFATSAQKQVVIKLTAPSGNSDVTTIYFDLGVTPGFIYGEDVAKVFSNIPGAPSIYSFSADGILCSSNGYSPLTTSTVISLGIHAADTGNFLFAPSMLSSLDSTTVILLEDRQQNIFTDLRNNFYSVKITDTGTLDGRFFLHISSAIHITSLNAGCNNTGGIVNIIEDTSVVWSSANLYDSAGLFVSGLNNVAGLYSFNNLAAGNYKLVLFFNGDYITSLPLHLNGNAVLTRIESMPLTAMVGQQLTFHSITDDVSTYFWDFGEGSQINGVANPGFAFMQPGSFTVVLQCGNAAGCQQSDSITINVGETTAVNAINTETRSVWAYAKTINIVLNEELKQGAELKVYNMSGQIIRETAITQLTSAFTLNGMPDGYYIVSLQNNSIISNKNLLLVQ